MSDGKYYLCREWCKGNELPYYFIRGFDDDETKHYNENDEGKQMKIEHSSGLKDRFEIIRALNKTEMGEFYKVNAHDQKDYKYRDFCETLGSSKHANMTSGKDNITNNDMFRIIIYGLKKEYSINKNDNIKDFLDNKKSYDDLIKLASFEQTEHYDPTLQIAIDMDKKTKGEKKLYEYEMYIGQAKNILDRCASHYMPFSHDHLAISLSKYKDGTISYEVFSENNLDVREKEMIDCYSKNKRFRLFNNSSGGQGSERGEHLENSDFKQRIEQRKNSVEERAKRKLEKYMKKLDAGKKYFLVDINAEKMTITIQVKQECFTKKGEPKESAKKAFQKLLNYLGEK